MDYNKIWSLFNSENLSKRAMAKALGMSPSGFNSMMDSKTMTVETLEKIAHRYKKPVSYFFDTNSNYTSVRDNKKEPVIHEWSTMPKKNTEEPEITTYSCPDCISKQKEIEALRTALDAKEELLESYRGKRENQAPTGT